MKNPYAFPSVEEHYYDEVKTGSTFYPGMSLRDYFAGHAATGILSNSETLIQLARKYGDDTSPAIIATASYTIADAMLTEREKK